MISPLSSALSALSAFGKKMSVTSNNIANVNTDEFKKSRTTMQEGTHGGVKARIEEVDTPGYIKETVNEAGETVEVETSNVDLAEELTEMIPTKTAYSANLKSIKVHDEMMGSLLDIFS